MGGRLSTSAPAGRNKERTRNPAPISLVNAYKSESALSAFGLSASFLNNAVCLIALMKSSGSSDARRLGVVENLRKPLASWCGVGRY